MTTDRLAALIHDELDLAALPDHHLSVLGWTCRSIAARLAAAGVTVAQPAPDAPEYEPCEKSHARGTTHYHALRPRKSAP